MNRKWIVFSFVACVTLGAVITRAQIAGYPAATAGNSVPELIPYRGYLENNGTAYDGMAWLKFEIFTVSTSGTPLWTELQSGAANQGVLVSDGNFGVALGSVTPFTTAETTTIDNHPLFQHPELYLQVSVAFDNSGAYTTLTQRQRILASPYAMTARQAENLTASGNVVIGGTLNVAGTAQLAGDAQVGGTLSAGHIAGIVVTPEVSVLGGSGSPNTAVITTQPTSSTTFCTVTSSIFFSTGTGTLGTTCQITSAVSGTNTIWSVRSSASGDSSTLETCSGRCVVIP